MKYNIFSFIGGEPTIWKFINEAILFLQNKRKFVNVFTNGVILLNVFPNSIVINGNNFFDLKFKNEIEQNLEYYKNKGVKISLRFNIDERFDEKNIEKAVILSKKFAESVSLSILYPVEEKIEYGKILYKFSLKLYEESIKTTIPRATPLCLFNKKERNFLKSNCNLKGNCRLPSKSLVVNPDGITIQPCIELPTKHKREELKTTSLREIFLKNLGIIKSNINLECRKCTLYLRSECYGGCLSYCLPDSFFKLKSKRM